MMRIIACILSSFFLIMFVPLTLWPEEESRHGSVTGQVIDAATQQPLIGVNIQIVERPTMGAATNDDGTFSIGSVPVGEYSLRATIIGYTTAVVTNVPVSTGRSSKVKIRLQESTIEMEGVEVKADYFSSAGTISPVSTIGLSGAEVLRSPGASQDMQRIVQSVPGVTASTDQTNELIVRGGAPNENLTVMDYIEIPSTNHYPNQYNSGGPINMVNVDMIEDIRFSTGGFPAQYGDKLSSVMDITIREGDRQRMVASNTGAHFAGVGTLLEGGFASGKGSWIFSARQSFLEALDNVMGISSIGLTAIPKYYDLQFKVVYDLSPVHKIIMSGLYGNDRILMEGETKEKDPDRANTIDSSSVYTVDFKSHEYAGGISLKSLWGTKGFSVLTLSTLGNRYYTDVLSEFGVRRFDVNGEVSNYTPLTYLKRYNSNADERIAALKAEMAYRILDNHELSAGAQLMTTMTFSDATRWYPDTTRYDFDRDGVFNDTVITRAGDTRYDLKFGEAHKVYGYVSDKIMLTDALQCTIGMRYDYFYYSEQGNVSPRLSVSYEILPPMTKLNFAYGEFYQTQSFPLYNDNGYYGQTDYNRHLKNSHARHFVLGVEHILAEGLKASLEIYHKQYTDLPVSESFVFTADKTYRGDRVLNVGRKKIQGIDFFLQQKQVEDFYGTLSLSYSSALMDDPRKDLPGFPKINVGTYPAEYDFPYLVTVVAGKIFKGFRSWLDGTPFFIKYPSVIFPFSDDMELGLRFRYMSGNVYTPKVFVTNEQSREGGIKWSKGGWIDSGNPNSARYPAYHRLDIQWISRYHLSGWNMTVFIQIQNFYNRANVFMEEYRSDGTKEKVYQYSFFPVGGISVEF